MGWGKMVVSPGSDHRSHPRRRRRLRVGGLRSHPTPTPTRRTDIPSLAMSSPSSRSSSARSTSHSSTASSTLVSSPTTSCSTCSTLGLMRGKVAGACEAREEPRVAALTAAVHRAAGCRRGGCSWPEAVRGGHLAVGRQALDLAAGEGAQEGALAGAVAADLGWRGR
jgi:hypothetical protein